MKGDAMQTELSLSERHIYCKGFSGLARFEINFFAPSIGGTFHRKNLVDRGGRFRIVALGLHLDFTGMDRDHLLFGHPLSPFDPLV
jgi:hypothetical protein